MTNNSFEKSFRTFFGIKLPDEIIEIIAKIIERISDKNKSKKIRWIRPENLHITLTFLGNILEKQSKELVRLIQNDLINFSSFDVTFSSILQFPSEKFPKVLTLFAPNAEELIKIESMIRSHSMDCGINIEARPYKPHITIARIKGKYRFNDLEKINIPEMKMSIDNITLFRSDLSSEGAIYTSIAELRLLKHT